MTDPVRIVGNATTHFYSRDANPADPAGVARIAAYLALPTILREFGVEPLTVLDAAGVRADVFDDPDNQVAYTVLGRLLSASAGYTGCDHIGLLLGQRSRLAAMGLAGQIALCADTAGEGLRKFADFFTLQNTAATVSVISDGGYTRLVYAIAEPSMRDTGQLQLGSLAVGFNVLQDLCGPRWLPSVVTIASRAPCNLRPCQRFFRAPVNFDSVESALVFEDHWLDQPLPAMDAFKRQKIEADVLAHREAILADFPRALRGILRKQLVLGDYSMESISALLGVHRRTLDRRLKRHGVHYGKLHESVKRDVACQLLRDTHLQMRQVAESLHYSSAANFSTAFRRWTGICPSTYRSQAR